MRANKLARLFTSSSFQVIDIHIPFYKSNKLFRSLAARFKMGPLISKINSFILSELKENYDLIWIDKGVFITSKTLSVLKNKTKKLIHFTPDMAFYINKSSLFINNMSLYDFVVTTKTAEQVFYKKYIEENKIIVVHQGFDKKIHKKYYNFEEKEDYISFVGHFETYRAAIIKQLIEEKIKVKLVGKGWADFVSNNKNNPYFIFVSEGLFSEDYARFISKSIMSIGFIMKRVPELHTTRTFEIPACYTALLTESNAEIDSFYTPEEVIFYDNELDLVEKINYYMTDLTKLKEITENGYHKVISGRFEYQDIISEIINKIDGL